MKALMFTLILLASIAALGSAHAGQSSAAAASAKSDVSRWAQKQQSDPMCMCNVPASVQGVTSCMQTTQCMRMGGTCNPGGC